MTQEQRERIVAESPVHGPALLFELDGLRDVAAAVANLLGGPTASYVPECESQERADRIVKAVSMIAAALAGSGGAK